MIPIRMKWKRACIESNIIAELHFEDNTEIVTLSNSIISRDFSHRNKTITKYTLGAVKQINKKTTLIY